MTIASVGKPVLTMRGTDDVSRVLRHAAQGRRGALMVQGDQPTDTVDRSPRRGPQQVGSDLLGLGPRRIEVRVAGVLRHSHAEESLPS